MKSAHPRIELRDGCFSVLNEAGELLAQVCLSAYGWGVVQARGLTKGPLVRRVSQTRDAAYMDIVASSNRGRGGKAAASLAIATLSCAGNSSPDHLSMGGWGLPGNYHG